MKAGEVLAEGDWESGPDDWQRVQPENFGRAIDQRELNGGVIFAQPLDSISSLHLTIAQAGMGSMASRW